MAVLIEGFSLVIRNETLRYSFPGGRSAFVAQCGKWAICGDQHLTRVAFLHRRDLDTFRNELTALGFQTDDSGNDSRLAIVNQINGLISPCDWLELGLYQNNYLAAWLAGKDPAGLVVPDGWTPECAVQYLSVTELEKRFQLIETDGSIDAYRNNENGIVYYTRRKTE